MSQKTAIQWCDSTVNPTMGCDGCELWAMLRPLLETAEFELKAAEDQSQEVRRSCYAGILHGRFGGKSPGYAPTFEDVTLFPGRMAEAASWSDLMGDPRADKPWLNGMPRLIFVSDMSDALSAVVPWEFLETEIIQAACSLAGSRHVWLWLTKRPMRMARFSSWLARKGVAWPANLWPGTSLTSRRTIGRVNSLRGVGDEQTTRFVSLEPMIEAIDPAPFLPGIDWLILGGESGHKARPFHLGWALSVIMRSRDAGVPIFVKQLGVNVLDDDGPCEFVHPHAGDWDEWPRFLRFRQLPREKALLSVQAHGQAVMEVP